MTTLTKAEVYAKYAEQLVRFATGLVGPSQGPDVMSSAVVNERAYLYKSVLNEARRHHRGSMRRQALELRASPSRNADHLPNLRPDVLEAVGSLSVSQRGIVFLAYWEDMRPAEIARHLGLSEGTVHRQLRRGQDRLRRILNE